MALDTINKLVAALGAGVTLPVNKASIANTGAGALVSLWRATGFPAQGAIPTSFATCSDALLGTWPLGDSGALNYYVLRAFLAGASANGWVLYDRLAHMGGLNGTLTTEQSVGVNLVAAATNGRCQADGSDVEWFLEVYTDIGTSAVNATVKYQDGTDVERTVVVPLSGASPLNRAGRIVQIWPLSGYTIKSITSVQLSATTGTAGNFGVTARKRLTSLGQMIANIAPVGDFLALGAPPIADTACLELVCLCSTTATGVLQGDLKVGAA